MFRTKSVLFQRTLQGQRNRTVDWFYEETGSEERREEG